MNSYFELLLGAIPVAAIGYLINEVNVLQKDMQLVKVEVALLKQKVPKRKTDQS